MSGDDVGSSTIVVFTGLPGTGKSTLAEMLARTLKAPAFAGDWLMGALKPSGVLAGLNRQSYLDVYYTLLWTLVARQLQLGQSAVLDCLVNDSVIAQWREQATQYRARLFVVQCVCGDDDLHRRRVEGRKRDIPGWHEIDWNHVERMRDEFPSLRSPHLTVDAVNRPEDNVEAVLRFIGN